jgi:hypothetical protein
MAGKQAIKPSERAGGFTHKVGSTLYKVNVYFGETNREPLEDKILRLIKRDFDSGSIRGNAKKDLKRPGNGATINLPQAEGLPERGSA